MPGVSAAASPAPGSYLAFSLPCSFFFYYIIDGAKRTSCEISQLVLFIVSSEIFEGSHVRLQGTQRPRAPAGCAERRARRKPPPALARRSGGRPGGRGDRTERRTARIRRSAPRGAAPEGTRSARRSSRFPPEFPTRSGRRPDRTSPASFYRFVEKNRNALL